MTINDQNVEPKGFSNVGVYGAGAWGTALSQALALAGNQVKLFAREPEVITGINHAHENTLFLKGAPLSPRIKATDNLDDLGDCDLILMVPPAQFMRKSLTALKPHLRGKPCIVLCAKGVERGSDALMNEVLAQTLPDITPAVLAGPSFAIEVATGKPCAVTLACSDSEIGAKIARTIAGPSFRPYLSTDLIAAEAGGAIKNVLAIACGVSEGRGLGRNAHAALITRGFAEMTRLAVALGAEASNMMGLCGLGDLVLTCSSTQSRNMSTGFALGQGQSLSDYMQGRLTVAEGVQSAPAVVELGQKYGIDLPICSSVNDLLSGHLSVDQAIDALMNRPLRQEGL
jgi:glycerol-3-phosphate dehydrogenase (NAD(P)+)